MQLVAVDFLPPQVLHQQLTRVSTMMAAGQLQPLTQAAYSMTSVVAAMRLLAQASHVGKVRCCLHASDQASSAADPPVVTLVGPTFDVVKRLTGCAGW
jgi:hypothetical protein